MEGFIQVKGDPGQIAHILQQGEQGEEDPHRRQHHRHHPGGGPPGPLDQDAPEPAGKGLAKSPQRLLSQAEEPGQPIGKEICPHNGEPEDKGQQTQHHGGAGVLSRKDPVRLPVTASVFSGSVGDHPLAQLLRQQHRGRGQTVLDLCLVQSKVPDRHPLFPQPQLPQQARLSLQQLQGLEPCQASGCQLLHCRLHLRRIGDPDGHRVRPQAQIVQSGLHVLQAPFVPGDNADDRDTQPRCQQLQTQTDPLFRRLIQEIHADQHPGRDLQDLKHQIQAPLQGGAVAHRDHRIRLLLAQKAPGHLLLRRVGQEGIGPRQVYQGVGISPDGGASLGQSYGFSGPVAGVLPESCQRIEQRGFSHVGIPRQSHPKGAHGWASPSSTPALSSRRRAMRLPRTA